MAGAWYEKREMGDPETHRRRPQEDGDGQRMMLTQIKDHREPPEAAGGKEKGLL